MIQNKITPNRTSNISFRDWLKFELDKRGWSQTELLKRSQGYIKSRSAISAWLSHNKKPQTSGYVGISIALATPLQEVMYRAGEAPPPPQGTQGEAELIDVFRNLDNPQRETFLTMGKGMVLMNNLTTPQNGNGK